MVCTAIYVFGKVLLGSGVGGCGLVGRLFDGMDGKVQKDLAYFSRARVPVTFLCRSSTVRRLRANLCLLH